LHNKHKEAVEMKRIGSKKWTTKEEEQQIMLSK
jgi:hypothetical protein